MPRRTNVAIGIAFAALAAAIIAFIPREDSAPRSLFPSSSSSSSSSPSPSSSPPLPAPDEISVLTLAAEMADLDHLARLPAAPFVAKQASSYDRRSKRAEDGESW